MRGSFNKVGNSWGYTITIGKDETGKRIQKRYGKFKTKKDAEAACAKAIYELENGSFIDTKKWTVAEYMREWIEVYKKNIAINTYRGYKVNIENHIIPAIGQIPLQKLQPMDLQKLYTNLLDEKKLSPSSIGYVNATLRKGLNEALKMQYVQRNVALLVTIPRQKKYEASTLNADEISMVLHALQSSVFYLPTIIAIYLGLRRGEVLGLKWQDVDFFKGMLTVSRAYIPVPGGNIISGLKTQKSHRTLSIPNNLVVELKKAKKQQTENKLFLKDQYYDYDFICCHRDGQPIKPDAWFENFKKVLAANGVKNVRLHDLRHTNASLMLKAGVPMKVASERLGHTTIGITMDLYSHIDEDMQKDAADRIDKIINL